MVFHSPVFNKPFPEDLFTIVGKSKIQLKIKDLQCELYMNLSPNNCDEINDFIFPQSRPLQQQYSFIFLKKKNIV